MDYNLYFLGVLYMLSKLEMKIQYDPSRLYARIDEAVDIVFVKHPCEDQEEFDKLREALKQVVGRELIFNYEVIGVGDAIVEANTINVHIYHLHEQERYEPCDVITMRGSYNSFKVIPDSISKAYYLIPSEVKKSKA
jgi:hypothetical protein